MYNSYKYSYYYCYLHEFIDNKINVEIKKFLYYYSSKVVELIILLAI